ncbi:MAG: hypothetical protein HY703_05020 [Gemmatimonadetes bacterium]|nr:hypothetical protein [Gemmatimonadota bacterium]
MRRAAAALALAGLLACRPAGQPAPATAGRPDTAGLGEQAAAAESVLITLERGPCLGGCPVYSLAIHADGRVIYQGHSGARVTGTAVEQIAPDQVVSLAEAFRRLDYFSLADRYTHGEPGCERYIADLPYVITSLTLGGRSKRVEHDHGCRGAPAGLAPLEARIDEVAGSWRWTGVDR